MRGSAEISSYWWLGELEQEGAIKRSGTGHFETRQIRAAGLLGGHRREGHEASAKTQHRRQEAKAGSHMKLLAGQRLRLAEWTVENAKGKLKTPMALKGFKSRAEN